MKARLDKLRFVPPNILETAAAVSDCYFTFHLKLLLKSHKIVQFIKDFIHVARCLMSTLVKKSNSGVFHLRHTKRKLTEGTTLVN